MATRAEPVWVPQPGSQELFLSCPFWEVLYEGTRGPGKTDALLMDYAQDVGKGYGQAWRGILFREEATQLQDVIAKSLKWFPRIFPDARFIGGGEAKWRFAGGEELLFRHMRVEKDYWKYHGHEYPWVGWEELTNWPRLDCYESMKSTNRSSHKEVPRKYRATCNPFGVGHHAVKRYFIDPAPRGTPITDAQGRTRVAIHGNIHENRILMEADPGYYQTLQSIKDPAKRAAWLEGSWDIVAGGILEGAWEPSVHVLSPFVIPPSWRIDRAFDYGSSAPYAVGWWAEADGTDVEMEPGQWRSYPKGTLFLIQELYGWNGEPNEGLQETNVQICERVKEFERELLGSWLAKDTRIWPGPADSSIFDIMNGDSYAAEMERNGVRWERGYKGAGSRVQGWGRIRSLLIAAKQHPLEMPGLFIFDHCRQWLRTVPLLPRDAKKADDVDSNSEDHMGDMTRYRVLRKPAGYMGVHQLSSVR